MESQAQVILATEDHWFIGAVETRGERLLDLLLDHTTQYLQISEVRVSRRRASGEAPASLHKALVRKGSVSLVIPVEGKHESPEKRIHKYVGKRTHAAFLVLGDYEIRARLHLKGADDRLLVLDKVLSEFFPLTAATISYSGGGAPLESDVAFANKSYVSLLYIGEEVKE